MDSEIGKLTEVVSVFSAFGGMMHLCECTKKKKIEQICETAINLLVSKFRVVLFAELLERVLFRLGSADTDDQLEATVNKFLTPVLLKITSPTDVVRCKVWVSIVASDRQSFQLSI